MLTMTPVGRNRITKSGKKNQKACMNGKLQVLENIGSEHHQTSGDERKTIEKNILGVKEKYSKPNYIAEISSRG